MGSSRALVGTMLQEWREDRRRSQLDLAVDVGVSTRHLSYVETGKSKPSPELVLALADHLAVPLRERNALLSAAGYAPRYRDVARRRRDGAVRRALGTLIDAHDPYPAVVVDRHWNLVMANGGAGHLIAGVAAWLAGPPLNVYRATLHPEGLAPAIENLDEWSHHLLATLHRQVRGHPRRRSGRSCSTRCRRTRGSPNWERRGARRPLRRRSWYRCACASATRCRRGSPPTPRSAHPSTSPSTSCTSSFSTRPTTPPRQRTRAAAPAA